MDAIPIKDSQFARIVKAIGKISRHCMDSTVLAMTTWRTTMNPFIDFVDIAGYVKYNLIFAFSYVVFNINKEAKEKQGRLKKLTKEKDKEFEFSNINFYIN